MLLGKHLNKYYLRYLYFYIFGVISLVAVDVAQLYIPEFLGNIVDIMNGSEGELSGKAVSDITLICINLVVVAVIMMVGRMIWRLALHGASYQTEAGLRREMFQKGERLSQSYYHTQKVGTIMSWFTSDLETIEDYLSHGTVQIVDAFFLGILVIVKMLVMDWVMALFAFIPMILIIIWGGLVEKVMGRKWEERQKAYDRLFDFSQENFTGIRVIKAFVKESAEIHAFSKVARKNKETNVNFARLSVIFDCVIEILIALIFALIMGFGGFFVYHVITSEPIVILGHAVEMTTGELVTFSGYFDSLIWPLIALGSIVTMRSRAKVSLGRVSAFLDAPEDIKNNPDAPVLENVKGDIAFKNFTFTYPKKDHANLHDVNLEIKAGENVGIIGRVGSGKTTLVNTLLRLYNVEKGCVFIDGKDIMNCEISSVRNAIAYVPQDNFLFSDKIRNNISFSDESKTLDEIRAAAAFADVDGNIADFTDGYDTVSGERGVTLSGGQKQRISIARAYLKNSPILILDDSVSAVDVKTEENIIRNIKEKRAGKTTLVVASRASTVAHLDRIIVMNKGRVEAFGTPEELEQTSPTYQKMVYLQKLESEVNGGEK